VQPGLVIKRPAEASFVRPTPRGWQAALQNIKSPERELNLKKIIIIAGPKGAGKTTFARDFSPAAVLPLTEN